LCASGGKDGSAKLWDINEGKDLYSLETGDVINALAFSPIRYWLVAATNSSIVVWDLQTKVQVETVVYTLGSTEEGAVAKKEAGVPCTSLAWSHDGSVLYAGYANNVIRAYHVSEVTQQ
jgi:guanine nucleotide-binding protein subunit beta-2-like 1 protein